MDSTRKRLRILDAVLIGSVLALAATSGIPNFWIATGSLMLLSLLAFALLLAVLFGAIFTALAAKPQRRIVLRVTCSALVALLLAAAGPFTVTPLVEWTSWQAQRPARERVAQELIERARADRSSGERTERLARPDVWLSDSGEVEVRLDKDNGYVLFWDYRGILDSYNVSVYASDPETSRPPEPWYVWDDLEREGDHWWRD